MKFRRPTRLLAVVENAPLPAAAMVAALLLSLGVQMALPVETPIAEVPVAPVRHDAPYRPVVAGKVSADAVILGNPLFTPSRQSSTGRPMAEIDQLVLAGTARSNSAGTATMRLTDGTLISLNQGQRIGQWRLAGVGRDHALFRNGSDKRIVRIGDPPRAASGESPQESNAE